MTVFAIAMAKDEVDVIASTVAHMAGQVDHVIVADNGSTDGTRDVLVHLGVEVVDDPDPAYYQSAKMTRLAHLAGERGATWVVPFDADEIWYSPFADRIADLLEEIQPQWLVASARLFDHVATGLDDQSDRDPVTRIRWRRPDPMLLAKVACRVRDDLVIEQGNHAASYRGGATVWPDQLVVRHFPYRSPAQFVRKALNGAAAYAATDLPDGVGAHWRQYGQLIASGGHQVGEEIFLKWFHTDDPEAAGLVYDPAPVACTTILSE